MTSTTLMRMKTPPLMKGLPLVSGRRRGDRDPSRSAAPSAGFAGAIEGGGSEGTVEAPSDHQRTASGEDAGSGRMGWAVATVLGKTSSNLPSMISNTAGNERSFCPAKRCPGGLNFTP
jgi:hypothetical protein